MTHRRKHALSACVLLAGALDCGTSGGGLNLLPRWHYLEWDHWSLYLDGGGGFIYTGDTLRDPGTHFNFTLQAGIGATYNLTDRLSAMMGLPVVPYFKCTYSRERAERRVRCTDVLFRIMTLF